MGTVNCAIRWLGEYQTANSIVHKREKRPSVLWRFTPNGRLKINVDRAFKLMWAREVFGWLLGMIRRRVWMALARPFNHSTFALHTKAEALWAGLLITIHQGSNGVEIECDCASLGAAIARTDEDMSEVGHIVENCKSYLQTFSSIKVRHIYIVKLTVWPKS